jgi:hypothetical protein
MAYMFSYYALSLSWITSLINFALIGALGTPLPFVDGWSKLTFSYSGYILRHLVAGLLHLSAPVLGSQQYRRLHLTISIEVGRSR